MSVRVMSLVWDLDLPPGEKLVLLALADQANDQGTQCWPSVATIAKRSGQGERTVRRALADLEVKGHLTRDHRDGASTQYRVHPCQIGTHAETAPLPKTTKTPAKLAPKPSRNTRPQKATPSSVARAKPKAEYHRLPADWKPVRFTEGTVSRAVIDRRGQEWARAALERFRSWAANARDADGAGRKLDWQAAWVNWVIEQDERSGGNGQRSGNSGGGGSIPGLGRTGSAAISVFGAEPRQDVEPDFEALRRVSPRGGGEAVATG